MYLFFVPFLSTLDWPRVESVGSKITHFSPRVILVVVNGKNELRLNRRWICPILVCVD